MKLNKPGRLFTRIGASILLAAIAAGAVWAQNTTTQTFKHGETAYDTKVSNAEVVYVEGNDLVLRTSDGKIEHFLVPDSDRFTVNGNEVTVNELRPGTKLTQTITTSTTPRYVTTVQTIKGKVWHVSAPHSIILRLPDNRNHVFSVPDHAQFTIHGQPKTVFDLRKGMNVEATVITDSEEKVISTNKSVVAEIPSPATPREVGVLLIMQPQQASIVPASEEQPTETAQLLPETASSLPLIGLLGSMALATSCGLAMIRRRVTV
jgi:hypothetical protein